MLVQLLERCLCKQEPVVEPAGVGVGGRAGRRGAGAAVAGPLRAGAPARARAARPAPSALPVRYNMYHMSLVSTVCCCHITLDFIRSMWGILIKL